MSATACRCDAEAAASGVAARLAPVRARGRVAIELAAGARGNTYAASVAESGGYRVRFPRHTGRCEAVLINTGGGMAGGDTIAFDVAACNGARAIVTTPSAERVYRSTGSDTRTRIRLSLGAGASLAWMPQESILYSGSRLDRSLDVEMAANATLLVCEIIVFGRKAMGERLGEGSFVDQWRVRRDGRLVFAEALRLHGHFDRQLARAAVLRGLHMMATLLYVAPEAEERLIAVRDVLSSGCLPPTPGSSPGQALALPRKGGGDEGEKALTAQLSGKRGTETHGFASNCWRGEQVGGREPLSTSHPPPGRGRAGVGVAPGTAGVEAETAASAWNGLLCVRSIGNNVEAVRRDVAAVARILLREPMPRVWGN